MSCSKRKLWMGGRPPYSQRAGGSHSLEAARGPMLNLKLFDPAELPRLVVGELPGFTDEFRLGYRRPSIDLLREILAIKLWGLRRLVVLYSVIRARQGDDDLIV